MNANTISGICPNCSKSVLLCNCKAVKHGSQVVMRPTTRKVVSR